MIEFLRNWTINITIISVFVFMLEILMPSGSMKRFVKVIVGLLVIVVIVKPFLSLKGVLDDFNYNVVEASNFIQRESLDIQSSRINTYNQKQALELYENNLKAEIKQAVYLRSGVNPDQIEVELEVENNIGKKEFGSIKSVFIDVRGSGGGTIAVSRISDVEIGVNKKVIKRDKAEYNFIESNLAKDIRSTISKMLWLNEAGIKVRVQE